MEWSGHVRYAPKAEAIAEHQQLRDKPLPADDTAVDLIQAPKLGLRSIRARGLLCPDGQISDLPVQPHLQKFFRFRLTQIKTISFAVPSPRGAYRDRHGRGAGCGGRGSIGRVT
jgi:hypothetical protein